MYKSVIWIENDSNYGFSKACNIGELKSKFDLLLFLNPDTILGPNCLYKILHKNLDFNLNVVSIKQLDKKNKNTYAYGEFLSFYTFNGILRSINRIFNNKTKKRLEKLDSFSPDWISGSFVLISKSIFRKVNMWDERFWMYYEDMDLCKKIKKIGVKIIMINTISCYHFHGLSTRTNLETKIKTKTEVLISKIKYVDKHFFGLKKLMFVSIIYISIVLEHVLLSPFSKVKRGVLIKFMKNFNY
jgi:GT2 family glycosyltransferase